VATIQSLLRKISGLVPNMTEGRVPAHVRKDFIGDAMREHGRQRPHHVVQEQAASNPPIQEFALPAAFGDDDAVIKIMSPHDEDDERPLEKEMEWRTVKTSTGYKVYFPGKLAEKFRITYTLQWTEATLSLMSAADEDMVSRLCSHYVALDLAAYYADTVRGQGGSPADLVQAQSQASAWESLSDRMLEAYNRMVRGDDDHPRGVIAKSASGAVRREGFPHRRDLPRNQIRWRGGF